MNKIYVNWIVDYVDQLPIGESINLLLKVSKTKHLDKDQISKINNKRNELVKKMERHIVKQGETLYSISKMYGISFEKLRKLNPYLEESNNQINIGDEIYLVEVEK